MLQELTRPMIGQQKKEQPTIKKPVNDQPNLSPLLILGGLGLLGGLFLLAGEDAPIEAPIPLVEPPTVTLIPSELIRFTIDGGEIIEWQMGEGFRLPPTTERDAKKHGRPKSQVDGRKADKISFTIYDDWGNSLHDIDIGIIKSGGYEYLDVFLVDRNDETNTTSMVCDSLEDIETTIEAHIESTYNIASSEAPNIANWVMWHLRQKLPRKHALVLGLELPDPFVFDLGLWRWRIEKLSSTNPADEEDGVERFKITGFQQHGNLGEVVIEWYLSICPVSEPHEGILLSIGDDKNHDPYIGSYIIQEHEIETILRNHIGLQANTNAGLSAPEHMELIAQLSDYMLEHMRPSTNMLLG